MTKIEWADRVWNPVTGCTKVSSGCKNCYAETFAGRGIGSFSGGRKFTDVRTHADRLEAPLRWRKPKRVFVNSMSDLFHEDVTDWFIDRVFAVMSLVPRHRFQVLTKRPERMRRYMRQSVVGKDNGFHWGDRIGRVATQLLSTMPGGRHVDRACAEPFYARTPWPLPNVWLGVSCEDQHAADERIPLLLETPASVRFVSAEPLLGRLDLHGGGWLNADFAGDPETPQVYPHRVVDWVIAGGESGPGARPCDVAWIRGIVEQCKATGVACFVKQLGAKPVARDRWDMAEHVFQDADAAGWDEASGPIVTRLRDRKGADPNEWPEDLRVREFPRRT